MADYVLEQTPDGAWHANPRADDAERVTNVAGWDAVASLAAHHRVQWPSTTALNRFRAQFGEPPPGFDAEQLAVGDG